MFTNLNRVCRTALVLTASLAAVAPMSSANACNRGGYGSAYRGGYGAGYYRPAYYPQPVYAAPVYVTPAYSPVNYPVQTAQQQQPSTVSLVAQAKQLLKAREYDAANRVMNVALQREPKNAALLQLKSLILFAKSDFQDSAAMAYSGLSLGRAFDWSVVHQLYPTNDEYTLRYRQLSAIAKEMPDQPHLQFLLAYHHLMLGHQQEGRAALEQAQMKLPQDKLIPVLLSQLPKTEPALPTAAPPATLAADDAPPAIK